MTKGTCLCKAIEISTDIEPKATVACSCTSCQACSASAFTINLVYPKGTIEVTKGKEHLKVFKGMQEDLLRSLHHHLKVETDMWGGIVEKADSGNDVFRHFCDTCGNAIYTQTVDGTFFVKGPVLKGLYNNPIMHVFTRNLPTWAEGVTTGDRKKDGA
ncbi:putative CENP-V/GFA domain-containing protein [Seiridium unicorne]|uniref:CENP-V/GFA domain-containing protein n=1 Tax=Seiridium unicorne TaxID=138068 RepID=A0ABR2UYR8_9PEZI